jgi:hypothetical protein
MKAVKGIFTSLLLLSISCSSTWNSMISHPNAAVRHSSNAGDQIGLLIGFPVAIALSPVSMPIAASENSEMAAWLPLAPAVTLRRGCTLICGMPAWLICSGWAEKKQVGSAE